MTAPMNLPNYFLADLPHNAPLSPTLITEACQTLKQNRARYLAQRSTQSLIELLSQLAKSWLQSDFPFRKLALDRGPASTGFSRATLSSGLDSFFRELTPENFDTLLQQDLGHAQRLDQFTATPAELQTQRTAIAVPPELVVHIAAGNLPNPSFQSLVLGLLLRSAQFLKCARGMTLLPRLFAHSIYDADPKLGACLEIASWHGGNAGLERALFEEADCVTATGTDETLASIRQRLPPGKRFLAYGHRVSFGFIASDALGGGGARRLARQAAADVAAWDQLGCLSPHVIYVQNGGLVSPEKFAELLAESLAEIELTHPRGELPTDAAAAIASRRALYEVRAAHSPETRHWCSQGSTAWTVVYEASPQFQLSCLSRFVYVKSVKDLTEALQSADTVRGKVSTVGLAAPEPLARNLAIELARWGVTRVCPLGQMQNPRLTWRHDGRPALCDLVTWTDLESLTPTRK
jgi:hypothetical protein